MHVVTHEGNILMVSSRIFLPWYWIYLRWSRVYRSFPVVKVFHRSSKISAALFQNHIIHVFIIRRLTWFAVNSKILHEYGLEITTNHWWLHHGCWRWHDFLHFLSAAKQKKALKIVYFLVCIFVRWRAAKYRSSFASIFYDSITNITKIKFNTDNFCK